MNPWMTRACASMHTSVRAVFAAAAVALSGHASALSYEVVDLGPGTIAYAVNDRQQVAGSALDSGGQQRPAIFRNKGASRVLLNDIWGYFRSINTAGEAVGHEFYFYNSFHWKRGVTTMYGAQTLVGINDSSTMVGSRQGEAVKVEGGVTIPLGTMGATNASATAIDSLGNVYAIRTFDAQSIDSVRVRPDGTVKSLSPPLPAEGRVEIRSVSSNGSNIAGNWVDNALQTHAIALVGGRYVLVDGPGTYGTQGASINDRGALVGTYGDIVDNTVTFRAFLWDEGALTDLSSLPDVVAAGWTRLSFANAINNRGVIVGEGNKGTNERRGFMLIPKRR